MIWSERRNFCFIHIPKTGGSSIAHSYNKNIEFSDILLGGPHFAEELQHIYKRRFGVQKHSFARTIVDIVGEDRWKNAYTFALVRSPVQRLASYYQWLQKPQVQNGLLDHQKLLKETKSFEEFAMLAAKSFMSQIDFVTDKEGKLIVSELIDMGKMDSAWPYLSRRLGVEMSPVHENRSPSLPLKIDPDVVKFIEDKYARDVTLYRKVTDSGEFRLQIPR